MDATPPPAAEPEPVPLPPPPLPLPADPAPPADEDPPLGFTLRRMCHIAVLLGCLFLVVRYVFVEPFGVTTGSMAETIHGNRREKACWRCGHPVCVGNRSDGETIDPQEKAACPNCGAGDRPTPTDRHPPMKLTDQLETSGDRLMVDKLVYRLRAPRRWEVAVFRCPVAKERKPIDEWGLLEARLPVYEDVKPCDNRTYVKRVVGLPGERIRLTEGDVYANGQLVRKDMTAVREVRIPVFRMAFLPQPMGWADRWQVGPAVAPVLPAVSSPKLPAVGEVVRDTTLVLDATATPFALTYRHHDLDKRVDFPVDDRLAYNGPAQDPKRVHDFMAECEVEVVSGQQGVFSVHIDDGADVVSVDLPIRPDAGSGEITHGGTRHPFNTPFALVPGKKYTLEFAFFDRRAVVAIDGKQMAPPLDLAQVTDDQRQPRTPKDGKPVGTAWAGATRPVRVECRGGHVVVRQFTLWRDIYYRAEGNHGVQGECQLGADEYFMLGDNSNKGKSLDSREWGIPGVPERDFLGKPFLVHQPLKRVNPPAFGALQHVPDWERIRVLR